MKVLCLFSLESPQQGDSNEYTQYIISQYKKENNPKLSQICNYGICSKGPKNEFEPAVVNEPSVFKPSKFYCMYTYHIFALKISFYIRPLQTFQIKQRREGIKSFIIVQSEKLKCKPQIWDELIKTNNITSSPDAEFSTI